MLLAFVACLPACAEQRRSIPILKPGTGARTKILAADGTLITEVVPEQNRKVLLLNDIPLIMQNAVIAIEDERFWDHSGVDPRALVRALTKNSQSGATSQGGSTITQQFIKMSLLSSQKTLGRKLEEAALALQVERNFSKDVILEQYLNIVFLGNRSYGVEAAAQGYFGKSVKDITIPEAALLAGLVQSPSRYDPTSHPEPAMARRDVVLHKMADLGFISQPELEAALATPLQLKPPAPPDTAQAQGRYPAPHFVDEVRRFVETDPRFGATAQERHDLLTSGGLTITTTLDLGMQKIAEDTLAASFKNQGTRGPDAALSAIDPRTGFVRAMVGGYDYWDTQPQHSYAQLNLAAGKGRQTGSTFKAIALAAAVTNGISMSDTFNAPGSTTVSIPGYAPWNLKGDALGRASLTQCTIHSANTCFANLVADKRVLPTRVTEYATKMGIDTSVTKNAQGKVVGGFMTVPAEVLGSNDNTVVDMTSAYGTFANKGAHVPHTYVSKVVGADGAILFQATADATQVMSPDQALSITQALSGVLTSGTASGEALTGRPSAGKTGTTQNQTDAWFVGYTPDLVCGIWVGYAALDNNGRLRRVNNYGGRIAAPAWNRFMNAALANTPPTPFEAGPAPGANPTVDTPTPAPTTTLSQNTKIFKPLSLPGSATMGDFTNRTFSDANGAAQKQGLVVQRSNVDVPGALPGMVLGQSPPAGTKVTGGATVVLETTPGTPIPSVGVLPVLGTSAAAAQATLKSKGWQSTVVSAAAPPGSAQADGTPVVSGQVWATYPAAGAISPDGNVVLYVQP